MDTPGMKIPENPSAIFDEMRKIDLSKVNLNAINFGNIYRAIEWVFYVGNDWINDEGYWTNGGHWGAKYSQRDLAFTEFLSHFRIMRRGNFRELLERQLPALSKRLTAGQIQDVVNLLHLYFVVESARSLKEHTDALLRNQGGFHQVDANQFNHNGITGHGAGPDSERYVDAYSPVGLRDVRTMRNI